MTKHEALKEPEQPAQEGSVADILDLPTPEAALALIRDLDDQVVGKWQTISAIKVEIGKLEETSKRARIMLRKLARKI